MDVDVDVMMSGLVPFLLCPLLQGPWVGPLRPEVNFLRQTPSMAYWNLCFDYPWLKAALLAIQLSLLQVRARTRAILCGLALTESKHAGCQASRWGVALHLTALRVSSRRVRL